MIEVYPCKEPYHRQALGYRGRSAPEGHREHLVARRGYRLILNMAELRWCKLTETFCAIR